MSKHDPEAFLMSVGTSMEADMIESLLKVNEIPVLRKYREAGGYLMVMMGGTVYGVDIYVPEDLLDKAREVVENSREASEDKSFPDNVKSEETAGEGPADKSHAEAAVQIAQELNAAGDENVSAGQDLFTEKQRIDRRRRLISWLILLFFVPGFIWLLVALIRYLFDLFAGK